MTFFLGLPILHTDMSLDMYRFPQAPPLIKEVVPPRHRRKKRDDETPTNTQPVQTLTRESVNSRGAQFDLVEEAFPPLPGKY